MSKLNISEEHIIGWRRHFHEHPELSFKEVETSNYIYQTLESFGVYELKRLTPTSVIAYLRGSKPGKTLAFRADIDALPIHEESEIDFQSTKDGIMHACGHDAHTAILLGVAEAIAPMKDQIEGTVKLIFQHAEELLPGGAQELVKNGVMDDVDYVFGLHVFPMLPTGSVLYKSGPLTAASDTFTFDIQGRGSHGSMPDLSIDPISIGAEIINSINNIISREINAFDSAVISIGKFQAGHAPNVIPDTASIAGTVRTFKPETRDVIQSRITAIIDHVCEMHGATHNLTYTRGYDSVQNDKVATQMVVDAAKKVIPEQLVIEGEPLMGSEDFSAYTTVQTGAFFGLGVGLPKDGYAYINHHPKFKIDEAALVSGTRVFAQIIEDELIK